MQHIIHMSGLQEVLLLNNADGSIKTAKKKMALDLALINNDTLATSSQQKFCNAKTKVADLLLEDKEKEGSTAEAKRRRFVKKIIYAIIADVLKEKQKCENLRFRNEDGHRVHKLHDKADPVNFVPDLHKIPFAYYNYITSYKK